jgi:oxygen-dependent protoporphyrinogen oxidase
VTGRPRRVVVVGGGLAGLVVAYRVRQAGGRSRGSRPEVTVVEATDRLGGAVRSMDLDGVAVEAGPDSFVVRKPWAVELCEELGLGRELIQPGASGAFVWARDGLVPYPQRTAFGVPSDVESLLRWPGMSVSGRLRAVTDLWRPARRPREGAAPEDESIGSLATRRLGAECAGVLVGPLLAGINSGDPDRLSVAATFPELLEWERAHGSLIRGARASRRAASRSRRQASPYGRSDIAAGALFATLRGGLSVLVDALGTAIGDDHVSLGAEVDGIERAGAAFRVRCRRTDNPNDGASPSELDADAIVLASPAYVTARLLSGVDAEAAELLASMDYGSSAVVALAYPDGTAAGLPHGTGLIVPPGSAARGRPLSVTAATWLSRKWPDAAFGDRAVVRAFVGRAGDERALAMTDPELVATVVHDLDAVTPLGVAPDAAAIARWEREMPRYDVGHVERVERIERLVSATPGVFVTGSAYRGVGIADVVRHAGETAERVLEHLRAAERTAAPTA